MVWCLARDDVRGAKVEEASGQAVDLVLVELVLCLIAQSASFMYRYFGPPNRQLESSLI